MEGEFLERQNRAAAKRKEIRDSEDPERQFNPPGYIAESTRFTHLVRPVTRVDIDKASQKLFQESIKPAEEEPEPIESIRPMSQRSRELALRGSERKALAVFPPVEAIDESQMSVLLKRFGIRKAVNVEDVKAFCAIKGNRFSCKQMKTLIVDAIHDSGQSLSRRLHRTVTMSLAKDVTVRGGVISSAPGVAFPTSPRRPISRAPATQKKSPVASRPPGYLPDFYDDVAPMQVSGPRYRTKHTISNHHDRSVWH